MRYQALAALCLFITPSAFSDSFTDIFSRENIGKPLAKIAAESKIKPSHEAHEQYKFSQGACHILAHTREGIIHHLKMPLSAQCQPDWLALTGQQLTQAQHPNYQDFEKLTSAHHYYATCLSSCGNAADPSFFLFSPGSRADGFVDLIASTTLAESDALAAADKWRASMANQGEDYLLDAKFNCDPSKHASVASTAFAAIKIEKLELLHDATENHCHNEY